MRVMFIAVQADFLLFLSSSTSVNSASTTSSFAASLAASLSACCLYIASPSFIEACASVLLLALIASASSPFSASFKSLMASSMARRSLSSTFEPCSASAFSVECTRPSAWFLASTASRRFLSSAALASASLTIFWMSASDRPPEAWIRICCSLPVALSLADTLTMPLASISKVTSICGIPRGDGGMPIRSNWPRTLLSAAISRSPWKTRMVTAFWLSSAVENTWLFLVGIVVLRSMMRGNTPPSVALQHAGLDRGTDGHDFVGIDALVRLLAEQLLHHFLDLRHAGHAADQHHFADLASGQAGVLQGLAAGLDGLLDEVIDQCFELGARQLHRQLLRTGRIGGDERQIDFGLRGRGQFNLGLFGGLFQALQGKLVVAQVDALLFLEFIGQIVDQPHVEIFAAQERVAVGRLHFKHAVADLQHRDVEGAAAEIVYGDGAGFRLVETVGKRRRGRLVDDAKHFKAGDLAGILGGLALRVVEIGGHGDDGLVDLLAEMGFGGLFHLLQNESRDLRGRVGLAVGFDPGVAVGCLDDLVGDELLVLLDHRVVIAAADEALDREESPLGIGHRLALGRLPDEALAIIAKGDDRRGRPHALGVFDDFRCLAIHYGDARIRGAEIDPNDLSHGPHILLFAAGWLGPDGAPIQTPNYQMLAILRR